MSVGCVTTEYLLASYKGVTFEAIEATSEHGRRSAVGEFPFGEDTAFADLGRKNRSYSIKARFVENSHLADVDALIAAVESPGSGTFVHPTRGIINAACKSIKVTDNIIEEQGISYADLEFIEANDWPSDFAFGGPIFGVTADLVLAAAEAQFFADYVLGAVPFHRRDAVLARTSSIISAIQLEYSKANSSSSDEKVYRVISDFDVVLGDPILLSDASVVKTAIAGGMAAIGSSLNAADLMQAMRRVANASSASSGLPREAGKAEDAVIMLARVNAGAYMGQAATGMRYRSIDAALDALDTAAIVLAGEAAIAYARCENALFIELRRYTVALAAKIYNIAYTLPGVVSFDFSGGVHPLAAAYSIYGDAKRHRELEESNVVSGSGRFNTLVIGEAA